MFALVLVLFTGWIGSIVVSTNLLPWMITFHMLLALGLVAVLLYVNHRAQRLQPSQGVSMDVPVKVQVMLMLGTVMMLVQVVLGTQVREEIDRISFELGGLLRDEWIGRIGIEFLIHRSFSLAILGVHLIYFLWAFRYTARNSKVSLWSQVLIGLVILEIATGMGMAYFGIPAMLQPIHLLLGSLILGVEFVLILQLKDHIQFKLN